MVEICTGCGRSCMSEDVRIAYRSGRIKKRY